MGEKQSAECRKVKLSMVQGKTLAWLATESATKIKSFITLAPVRRSPVEGHPAWTRLWSDSGDSPDRHCQGQGPVQAGLGL